MKIMMLAFLLLTFYSSNSQSIVGKWQLAKETSCLDEDVQVQGEEEELVKQMKSMSNPSTSVIHFKENNTVEESTRIVNSRKTYNSKTLLYKFSEQNLFVLDKKSHTIIESFTVEKLSADSLIISNTSRPCETKVFLKIK
jgi:hypothetical protein